MFGVLKSPLTAQLERQCSRYAMTAFGTQTRSIMSSNVGERNRKHGMKKVFIPVSMRSKGITKEDRKPTPSVAHALPLSYQEMDNSTLVTLGNLGEHGACKEMLKRHIMDVDSCDYDTATAKYQEIAERNLEGTWLVNLPYKLGIAGALVAAFGSFPMVFDLGTATWFNEFFVTTDLPEARDLETPLEVGAWTWNVSIIPGIRVVEPFGMYMPLTFCMNFQNTVDGAPSWPNLLLPTLSSICK